MNFGYDIRRKLGRMNIYRNREFAVDVAQRTGGEFVDTEFTDEFGKYWIVIWR